MKLVIDQHLSLNSRSSKLTLPLCLVN